jgi:3-carboxy-cis,cis-muconate cycloisomerase
MSRADVFRRVGVAALAAAVATFSSVVQWTGTTGRTLGETLAESPEIAGRYSARELAELCEPTGYTGAAGSLVDRALRDRPAR